MQFFTSLLALAGLAAALPGGEPGYKDGGYGAPDCMTSSTCKAVYHTTTKTVPYESTKTITVTTQKPVTIHTVTEKYIPVTYWKEKVYNVTKTVPYTTTITKPVVSSKVVCKTFFTTSYDTTCSTGSTTSICPETTKMPASSTTCKTLPTVITTSTYCPTTTTSVCTESSTTVCTETSSKCHQITSCKDGPSYPTGKPDYKPEYKSEGGDYRK